MDCRGVLEQGVIHRAYERILQIRFVHVGRQDIVQFQSAGGTVRRDFQGDTSLSLTR